MKKKLLRSISLLMAALMIISSSSVSALAETLSYAEAGDAEVYEYEEIENLGSEEPVSSSVTDISSSEMIREEEEIEEEEIKTELPDVSENSEEETETEEDMSMDETYDPTEIMYTGVVKVSYKNSKKNTVTKKFINDDIASAIELACENNGTITLASNVFLNHETAVWEFNSGNVTINLGSYSIMPGHEERAQQLINVNGANLTIKGTNAKMTTEGSYLVKSTGNSTLTVDGVNFSGPRYAFLIERGTTFNMKSGSVTAAQPVALLNRGAETKASTFNMYKGTISGRYVAIFAEEANVNIFGGTVNCVPEDLANDFYFHSGERMFSAIQVVDSKVNISGGTISCKADSYIARRKGGIILRDSDIKISGGTISVEAYGNCFGILTISDKSSGSAAGSVTVSGGLINVTQKDNKESCSGIILDFHELNMSGGSVTVKGNRIKGVVAFIDSAPKENSRISGGTIKCEGLNNTSGYSYGIYTANTWWKGSIMLGKASITVTDANSTGINLNGGTVYAAGTNISVNYKGTVRSNIAGVYLGMDSQFDCKDSTIKVTSYNDNSTTRVFTSAVGITNYNGEYDSTDVIAIVESSDIIVSSENYAAGINVHDAFVEVDSSNFNISGSQSVYGVDYKETVGSFIGLEIYDLNIDAEIKKEYESYLKTTISSAFDARTGIYGISAKFSSDESAIIKRSKINLHGGKNKNAIDLIEAPYGIIGYGITIKNGVSHLIEGNTVKCNADRSIPNFSGLAGITLEEAKGTYAIKNNSVNICFAYEDKTKAGIKVTGASSAEKAEKVEISDNIVNIRNYFNSDIDIKVNDIVHGISATNVKVFELTDNDVYLENIKDVKPVPYKSYAYGISYENGNELSSVGNRITVKNSGKEMDSLLELNVGNLHGQNIYAINKVVVKKNDISVTGYNYSSCCGLSVLSESDYIIEDTNIQTTNNMSPSGAYAFQMGYVRRTLPTSVEIKNCTLKSSNSAVNCATGIPDLSVKIFDSTLESVTRPPIRIDEAANLVLCGKVTLRDPNGIFFQPIPVTYSFVTDKGEVLSAEEVSNSGAKEITLYDPVFSSVEITAPNKVYQGLKDGKFSVEIEFRNNLSYMVKPGTVVWKINGNTVESAAITKTSTEMLVENFDSLSYVSFGENEITWSADIIFEGGEQHYEAHKKFNYYPTVTFYAYDSAYLSSPTLVDACSFADGTKEKTTYVEKGKSVAVEDIPTFTPSTGEKFSFTGWVDSYGRLLTGSTVINSSETYYALFEADGLTIRKLSPLTTYTSETINTVVKDVVYRPGGKIVLEDILPSSEYGIYYGQKLLTSADYKVTYKNNDKVTDSAKVTITGKGKYKGQISFTFNIVPYDFSYVIDTSSIECYYKYTGNNISVKGISKLDGFPKVSLKNGRDYKLTFRYSEDGMSDYVPVSSMKKIGYYTIDINGIGNYKGCHPFYWIIHVTKKPLISDCKVYGITNLKYTGGACTFDKGKIVLKYKNKVVPSEYYRIDYNDNTQIGDALIQISAESDSPYEGYLTRKFKIYGVSLDNKSKDVRFEWVDDVQNFVYHNEGYRPAFKIYDTKGTEDTSDDKLLKSGTDCSYEFTGKDGSTATDAGYSPKAAGKVTLKITGMNTYSGTYTTEFNIKPVDLSKAYAMNAISTTDGKITLEGDGLGGSYDVIYNKESNKPTVKLVMGMGPGNSRFYFNQNDYSISYKNYSKAGKATMTITGKNNLKGSIKVNYNISKAKLSTGNGFKISANDVVVNSKPGKYATTVKVEWSGKVLSKGKDYDSKFTYTDKYGNALTSKSKPKVGDVINVTIKGKGNFTGSLTAKYVIVKKTINSLKASTITKRYTGSNILLSEKDLASMKIKIGKTTLVYNKDYVISGYSNNTNTGTAKVTITGIGDYSGSKEISFKISQATFKWWK